MSNHFLQMALNNAWANGALFAALEKLTGEEFHAERPSFFGSISRTMNHIHEVDLYYVDALEEGGKGRSVYARDDIDTVAKLARAQAEVDHRLAAFCRALTPEILEAKRYTERTEGEVHERVDRLLLHLFQHQIHHRGQVHAMLTHAGHAPPQLDDFYLEHGRVPSAQAYWS